MDAYPLAIVALPTNTVPSKNFTVPVGCPSSCSASPYVAGFEPSDNVIVLAVVADLLIKFTVCVCPTAELANAPVTATEPALFGLYVTFTVQETPTASPAPKLQGLLPLPPVQSLPSY